MCDLYEQSLYTCEGIFEPSIVLFYKAEEKLRNYIIDMVENIVLNTMRNFCKFLCAL